MRLPAACLLALALTPAYAEWGEFDHEFEADKPWAEVAVQLPAAPQAKALREFAVSPVAPHRYLLDSASIRVGSDRVVRYTVVIESRGGVRNVFFEGMRCETAEARLYAYAQPDTQWARAPRSGWQGIKLRSGLSYQKALYEDVLCPDGIAVKSAEAAVSQLSRQAH